MKIGKKSFLLMLLFVFFGASLGFKIFVIDRRLSYSSLQIDSFPKSTVFLDDREMGQTPYLGEKLLPGEYRVKLVSSGKIGEVDIYEVKIKLGEGVLTYLRREFGPTNDESGGQIVTLEKLGSTKEAELAVVSSPDGAKVVIDGIDKGIAPIIIKGIEPGEHEVTFSSDGFSDQIIRSRMIAGYRVAAIIKLAKGQIVGDGGLSPTNRVSTAELLGMATLSGQILKPYVIVKETPTGFLRVRVDSSINSSESGRIFPGEKYSLLSEIYGWAQIKLATISGWVSDQYVEKVK